MTNSLPPAVLIALYNAGLSAADILAHTLLPDAVALITRDMRRHWLPRLARPDGIALSDGQEAHVLHALRQWGMGNQVFYACVVGDRVELYPLHHDTVIYEPGIGPRNRPGPVTAEKIVGSQIEPVSATDPEPAAPVPYHQMRVKELRALARDRGIFGWTRMRKARLAAALEAADEGANG